MRQGRHPGEPRQPRRLSVPAESAGEFRLTLPPGTELHAGLVGAVTDLGLGQAALSLLAGSFERFGYLTGQPDDSGARLATYGAPTHPPLPVNLIGANALIGSDAEGKPLLHCHAVVVDAEGRIHGGHLPPDLCVIGEDGLTVHVLGLAKGGFAVAYDAETNYAIFHPAAQTLEEAAE